MGNIRKYLDDAVKKYGEPIEAIVIGTHDNDETKYDPNRIKPEDESIILSPEIALRKLDAEYDSGFGGSDCFPVYAWTKSRVFFIGEYDGATGLKWVPRNPVSTIPEFSGVSE